MASYAQSARAYPSMGSILLAHYVRFLQPYHRDTMPQAQGTYLALTTLPSLSSCWASFFHLPISRRRTGNSGIARLTQSRVTDYYTAVVVMLGLCTIMWKITDSNIGIISMPFGRTNWLSGLSVLTRHAINFWPSPQRFFAGISGGLYAHFMRIAGPSTLDLSLSFSVVIYAFFGGIVTIYGPVGAVFILFQCLSSCASCKTTEHCCSHVWYW